MGVVKFGATFSPSFRVPMSENFNIYEAPKAALQAVESADEYRDNHRFYVVSVRKFVILYIATLGLYSKYWFYKNFKLNKVHQNNDDWPVLKAIFNIFFVHGLFESIKAHLALRQREHAWDNWATANMYILWAILTFIFDRLAGKNIGTPATTLIYCAGLGFLVYFMLKAQRAINAACLSENVDPNDKLTWANLIWVAAGVLIWIALIVVTIMEMTGQQIK